MSYTIDLKDLLEAGCHFGHLQRRWNPKMDKYIYTTRDGVSIFDLAITAKKLEEAMEHVKDLVSKGKTIVFVGTKRQAQAIIKEEAERVGAPFISVRWMGGIITNWEEISKRIRTLKDMIAAREKGEYKAYTKKEQGLIDKKISKLNRFLGGLTSLNKAPDAVFVVDTHKERVTVKEANIKGVDIIGIVDSNAEPDEVNMLIPANDDAVRSIKLIVENIAKAYADGKELLNKGSKISKNPEIKKDTKEK